MPQLIKKTYRAGTTWFYRFACAIVVQAYISLMTRLPLQFTFSLVILSQKTSLLLQLIFRSTEFWQISNRFDTFQKIIFYILASITSLVLPSGKKLYAEEIFILEGFFAIQPLKISGIGGIYFCNGTISGKFAELIFVIPLFQENFWGFSFCWKKFAKSEVFLVYTVNYFWCFP